MPLRQECISNKNIVSIKTLKILVIFLFPDFYYFLSKIKQFTIIILKIDLRILYINVSIMSIILLRGFSRSGKDFVGSILCEKYGYKRFSFADSLKKMIQRDFNCSWEQLHTQEGKLQICENDSKKRTYRQILIDEALRLRNIDSGIFAKHCCSEIYELEEVPKKIVITDWRYPNEIEILKQAFPNFQITPVHLIREGQITSPVNDISEYQLDDRIGDHLIINKMNNSIIDEIKILINLINSKM